MNWSKRVVCFLFIAVIPLTTGCSGESDELARKKLEVILKDDLEAILEGVADTALLPEPYYDLVSYKLYDEGKYSKKAEVDFYFLKSVNVKIVRKYRYLRSKRMWERYFNDYSLLPDKADSSRKQ
ncbi:MAG: hypothetical protein GX089_06930 [Fibrobacter sp.]|jgi:hypothetical protein|nr:hypothetical protein [Fibrobacter sp.]